MSDTSPDKKGNNTAGSGEEPFGFGLFEEKRTSTPKTPRSGEPAVREIVDRVPPSGMSPRPAVQRPGSLSDSTAQLAQAETRPGNIVDKGSETPCQVVPDNELPPPRDSRRRRGLGAPVRSTSRLRRAKVPGQEETSEGGEAALSEAPRPIGPVGLEPSSLKADRTLDDKRPAKERRPAEPLPSAGPPPMEVPKPLPCEMPATSLDDEAEFTAAIPGTAAEASEQAPRVAPAQRREPDSLRGERRERRDHRDSVEARVQGAAQGNGPQKELNEGEERRDRPGRSRRRRGRGRDGFRDEGAPRADLRARKEVPMREAPSDISLRNPLLKDREIVVGPTGFRYQPRSAQGERDYSDRPAERLEKPKPQPPLPPRRRDSGALESRDMSARERPAGVSGAAPIPELPDPGRRRGRARGRGRQGFQSRFVEESPRRPAEELDSWDAPLEHRISPPQGEGLGRAVPVPRMEPALPVDPEISTEGPEIDVPSWVEPELEEGRRSRRFLPKNQRGAGPELLPAGEGIEPEDEELEDPLPEALPRGGEELAVSQKQILINAIDPEEVRIAVLEKGLLEELYYERPTEKKYLGNIYKGRIVNLEPGIQAAFVDIGIGRNGFLHVSDVLPAYKEATGIPMDSLSTRLPDRRRLKIQEILRKGQEILVQISKDAIGTKGPSLTTYVSIPGKYLVLMPGVSRHGVSKRIQDDDERSSLRAKLSQLNPPKGVGYIVRTAGQHRPQADLEKDFGYLMKMWEELRTKVTGQPTPSIVYAETDLVTRTMRDLFGPDVSEILIDEGVVYQQARKFLDEVMPQAARRLKSYSGAIPLFSRFCVEEEIEKIYNRRVPLPSGGHIVLEQTEALVAIDVNSGKYRDEDDLEATALKTNLEAAQEIARQLRLRDLGGVIVNDFIDMETEANRRAVERALRVALKRDRAKSWISRISRFGIIEMTRQRVRPSFERSNHEPCRFCRGTGGVKSARSCGIAILRQIRAALGVQRREVCEVIAHPQVVDYLLNDRRHHLVELEKQYNKTIFIRADAGFSPDQQVIRYH